MGSLKLEEAPVFPHLSHLHEGHISMFLELWGWGMLGTSLERSLVAVPSQPNTALLKS